MKTRFNSFDIACIVTELQKLIGMRVSNIYDIDSKTYLIRLQRTEEKCVLLLESGNRIHTTGFEWPKNVAPSGFSMKLRKHLKNKRLEHLTQLGVDRVIDLQFGSNEAAYHVILELYDRGNIILTDYEMTILNVIRPHMEGDKIKFAVREKYPLDRAKTKSAPTVEEIKELLSSAKQGDNLRKILIPHLEYGPALLEHVLLEAGFTAALKIGKDFNIDENIDKLMASFGEAEKIMENARKNISKGYIIQKQEERAGTGMEKEYYYSNQEFHPLIFAQHASKPFREFETFDAAVDEFFSTLEGQKIDMKAIQQEREALKKLENVKKDHDQRLVALEKTQELDKQKAELITRNQELVDAAILAIQTALANQVSWTDIHTLLKAAQAGGDPIANIIKQLKLETNHITLHLSDPYGSDDSEGDSDDEKLKAMLVDVDLALSAFANARKYYNQKRSAAKKQQKTIESHDKALKSAEKKTKQTLKEVQAMTSISKARKVYWFEKFFWFISSENYLVIGGRDQQQNELIVKRYMRPNDVYVHADIHGASSVVIKNPTGQSIPPKTLNEAGTMAICYSVAWEAKVITNAWWVNADQVSKTAPTGEYLTTGSFMVRGKKNFLPPCHLVMGLSILFKLEDGSVERHKDERRIRTAEEELALSEIKEDENEDVDLEIIEESDEEANKEGGGDVRDEENIEKEESSSDDEDGPRFPDTHIKIQHFEGTKINILAESVTENKNESDDSDKVVYLGDDKPVVVKSSKQRNRNNSESKQRQQKNDEHSTRDKKEESQVKRGQKGKLKKIKEKYKDQDEEERKLRMDILQSAGSSKNTKKTKKSKDQTAGNKGNKKTTPRPQPRPAKQEEEDAEEEADDIQVAAEVDMLDSLTGNPLGEDELLFAVPVVAPYNTLSNYKFKVKLTPGTGKRGKAARTAVSMYLRERTTTPREKDLLRSIKDENLARNIPGKVKLSAPKMQALRK